LANYFNLLNDIARGGSDQTEFILSNFDYTAIICDVVLGSKSPKWDD